MQKIQSRIPLISLSSEPAAKPRKAGRPIKVLLIDGDHREAYLIRNTLAEAGAGAFTLEYTDRLDVGIERLARGGIDVLLLDPSVPDSHGRDALAWGRAQAMGVPVVILSAQDGEKSETEALKKGAQEYLVKWGLDGNLLVRSIYRAMARQQSVSERERKTRRLESSEAHLQNIIRSNPDGIIIADHRGIVRFINPAVETLFGCKAEQLLGESLDFLLTVEGGVTELGVIRGGGEKGVVEIRVVETKYQGEAAYLASLRDITERKQAEEETGLAMEKAEAAKAGAEEAAAKAREEASVAKKEAKEAKTAARKTTAKAKAEAKAASEEAIAWAGEEVRRAKEAAKAASEEAVARAEEEVDIAKKEAEAAKAASEKAVAKANEEARLAREEAEAVKAASEEAVAKANEEARLAREEAKATKMASQEAVARAKEEVWLAREEGEAAKTASEEAIVRTEEERHNLDPMQSEFMSNIVHELRAPLHSILAFTKLILEGGVSDLETQREFLTIIGDQSEHLRKLVDELVDISPVESGRFEARKERVATKELLRSAVREFYSVAKQKNIVIREDIPGTLPEMEVDSQRLKQVISNLLSNAIKFSDDGGSVSVKAEVRNGDLLVQVTDWGVGIAEEAMPSLFEKFFQAKNQAEVGGLGLGLYISKQIIEAHGGHIWAESTEGAGSTFSFTLPLEQANR